MGNVDNKELMLKLKMLEEENKILKEKLKVKEEFKENDLPITNVSKEEKINKFIELFKGREDVYAKRWVSTTTGKSGYSPVCKNDFNKYKCEKFKIKCSDCPHRELESLTKDIVEKHLKGELSIGIYPLLIGDNCNFIAIDFDKENYEEEVIHFWGTCDKLNIPVYVERSRSGNGAHVWIFFSETISARLARKMANILLTKTLEVSPIDLNSYDRILPNQDSMPKGGFGNLIALPFQGECAKSGNTVFVNKYFEPYENQFNIITNIKKMSHEDVYEFVQKYKEEDYEEPKFEENYEGDELPKKQVLKEVIFSSNIECIFDSQIYVKKLKLLPNEISYLKRLASFTNPRFYEMQKLRMQIYYKTTPRIITCFEEDDRFLILPRGCMDKLKEICLKSNVKLIVKDNRVLGEETNYNFIGKLTKKQERAKDELLKNENGILCAATGFGKTVVASKIISEVNTTTLVIANKNSLIEQWKERLSYFLDIDKKEIGQLGAGKNNLNGKLDIASFQTLYKKDNVEELVKGYGLVIIDECHHVAAYSFEEVLKNIKAKYVYGLTATPTRKDGWHKIIYMQCGDIRVRVSSRELKQYKELDRKVVVKNTGYKYSDYTDKEKIKISDILNDIAINVFRNNLILEDIKECIKVGRIPIVLTERIEHLKLLKSGLEDLGVPVLVYKGSMGKKKKEEFTKTIKEADQNNLPRIILATSSTIGEGFDDSRLDTLFLTMPVSWKGRIVQYVGRINRLHEGKKNVIVYDYLDDMKVLKKMYERRKKGYKIVGYEIEE